MGSRVKTITCPFCYPETFLTTASTRSRKARECPYCHRSFFYWRRRYYVCIKEIEFIRVSKI